MAGPSNIRINPFTSTGGATNYVELTEKHIIPAVSPYVIRLSEVPEKQDPSNMKMVYVDSATGAATENTLTEVAATPGQGEFRPDYSTNALEDKTWNTGLIEFSASDAGKIVQVTYTGTGTLAGVNSNHWPSWYTDRGDGSDGDFVPTENTTISGVKNYKSVFIKSGITVTVAPICRIKCQEIFINRGAISANNAYGALDGTAGIYGGNGGGGNYGPGGKGSIIELTDDNIKFIVESGYYSLGGAGGTNGTSDKVGGNGGGTIQIVTKDFKNNGTISANGGDGASTSGKSGGGGGGGQITIICEKKLAEGTISAKGGGRLYPGNGGANGAAGFTYIKELGV